MGSFFAVVLGYSVCVWQAEFEKEDIYEELKKKEESVDVSKIKHAEAVQLKDELRDKRLVVSEVGGEGYGA